MRGKINNKPRNNKEDIDTGFPVLENREQTVLVSVGLCRPKVKPRHHSRGGPPQSLNGVNSLRQSNSRPKRCIYDVQLTDY